MTWSVSEEGFVAIFNGESLEGWKCRPISEEKNWTVKNGAIVGSGKGQESYLMFEEELSDFELKFRYRLKTKGNTGLEVRGRPVPGKASRMHGYHADIGHVGIGDQVLGAWDFHENNRGSYLARRGELVVISNEGKPEHRKLDDALKADDINEGAWNEVRVVAKGNELWFTINGKMASKVIDNEKAKRLDKGLVAFQLHGGDTMTVEFKDISLKKME